MQLKVCNPHLSSSEFASLDEECDEKLCSRERCQFIKGFEALRDSMCYLAKMRELKTRADRKKLQLVHSHSGGIILHGFCRESGNISV